MREKSLVLWNILVFSALLFLGTSLQTSLWPHVFGSVPAPPLYISFVLYFSLYRRASHGVIYCYIGGLILTHFTSAGFGMLTCLLLINYFAGRTIKTNLFWEGASYDLLLACLSAAVFPILEMFLSWIFEPNPITQTPFLTWVTGVFLCAVTTPFLFQLFRRIDLLMGQDTAVSGAGET